MAADMMLCKVVFLDETSKTFELPKKARGQTLLDLVFRHLDLVERDFFGLKILKTSEKGDACLRWLDSRKIIRKQVPDGDCVEFHFKVKFFVENPRVQLQEEYTRYLYVLQLQRNIMEETLPCPPAVAASLAACAIQSELGDGPLTDQEGSPLANLRLLPNQNEDLEKAALEAHEALRGMTPAEAELKFLDEAKELEFYGIELHNAWDEERNELQVGVSSDGLYVYKNMKQTSFFSWESINKLSFKRRNFYVELKRDEVVFSLSCYRACKNLWKSCVEHHTFFRLPREPATDQVRDMSVPKVLFHPSFRRFPFIPGSKFRYTGKTAIQAFEESRNRPKNDKSFVRSFSKYIIRRNGTRCFPPVENTIVETPQTVSVGSLTPVLNGCKAQLPHRRNSLSLPLDIPTKFVCTPKKFRSNPNSPKRRPSSLTNGTANGNKDDVNGLVTIEMKADPQGRFGFNVKGGVDITMPVIVTRVAPNTPADKCYPKLNEGDQVMMINNQDVSKFSHKEVVACIRAAMESESRCLVLTVKPNVYIGEDVEEPAFQYVPEAHKVSPVSPSGSALAQSMLLLTEAIETGSLTAQFEAVFRRKTGMTMTDCRKPENVHKNRYKDILPYDKTRVVLRSAESGDYINANFVDMEIAGTGVINKFIAAQGPLASTCVDFWLMAWETKSPLVVMLTTVLEGGRTKCHPYWPGKDQSRPYGAFTVSCSDEIDEGFLTIRKFIIEHSDCEEPHEVTQVQYNTWPDHGVPAQCDEFVDFVRRIRTLRSSHEEAVIVHCSAGIGRTGVLILMDTAMSLIEANQPVYPLDIVQVMRCQRAMMIQTSSQYKFVCEAVVKVYREGLAQSRCGGSSEA